MKKLIVISITLLTLNSCKTTYYNIPVTWCDDFGIREDTLIRFEKNNQVVIKTKEGFNMHVSQLQIIN
jgi:hypothetical protein